MHNGYIQNTLSSRAHLVECARKKKYLAYNSNGSELISFSTPRHAEMRPPNVVFCARVD